MATDQTPLDDQPMTIPLHEESLEPVIHPIERGRVRITKHVVSEPFETTLALERDDVVIERVAVDRPVDVAPEPWQEGNTLVIPVVEAVIVTETKLVVREEVRITRRRVVEEVPVCSAIRKEIVDVEQLVPWDESHCKTK